MANSPTLPFLAMLFSISVVKASNTELISFLDKPVDSAMLFRTSVFEGALPAAGFLAMRDFS
jgi:hypothetical protein